MFEFHVSRAARDRYGFDDAMFSLDGNVVFANLAASREFAQRLNAARDLERHPERAVHAGALNAMGLIDEALHAMVAQYRQRNPNVISEALAWLSSRLGSGSVEETLLGFAQQFPAVAVYRGKQSATEWLAGSTRGISNREIALEEMLLLWLANLNPAFQPFKELFDDQSLSKGTAYPEVTRHLPQYFGSRPGFGPKGQNLIDMLRAPALSAPDSLEGQLAFIRGEWTSLLGDLFRKMLTAMDVLKEEQMAVWMRFHPPAQHFGGAQTWGDSSAGAVPQFTPADHEPERFSPDLDWMPKTVMIAKSIYVWLHQLSVQYHRHIQRLDQIPDEELLTLARRGFNGLWLIGVWERSKASQRIKQMCGNPEAAASAYSLYDYVIAHELGGEEAYQNLRDRAWARGIRLASDMVPNHMGIDSRWLIEHPDWFISLPYSPYPAYSFEGPDVSSDGRVEIKIEDHYFNRTDAAVVFRRRDRWSGDTCYIYHGNDGTSFPWNDTAQLNYLKAEVREAVIQTILHVARMFPIIRFDAAMTLTKRHYQRLWFPEPGTGGAIPSRAEHGLTKAQFDAAMPEEFWREVVDRVAAEAPNTLLLAEAFWLMEGYFVRTLGMHRVYNSAFMNMLRDEENANYRAVIKNTLSFDPEVLKRYVNFMNNPDERTAVDQFGKGDKYFGVCTLMATLPGLPMFGHGQIEGFTERYGMEYRRAYHDEQPDSWLVARHERQISPLLHRRYLFAEVKDFLLYDFFTDQGSVNEDVFAYSNRSGDDRTLVIFNNRYSSTRGWIRISAAYAEKKPNGDKHLRQRTLGESFAMSHDAAMYAACRDALSGLQFLYRARDIAERGMHLELHAYQCHVLLEWRDLHEDAAHPWGELCEMLAGQGVPSLEDALRDLQLRPVHQAIRRLLDPALAESLAVCAALPEGPERIEEIKVTVVKIGEVARELIAETQQFVSSGVGEMMGVHRAEGAELDLRTVEGVFLSRIEAALKLPALCRRAGLRWPDEAECVLPVTAAPKQSAGTWACVLAWCALEAMGTLLDAEERDTAAVQLFDGLRLRNAIADAFEPCGIHGEERWRAAARLRASFAHAGKFSAPYSWVHDPDVAWVIGVHEHEGEKYLVKEQFEKLLWWMGFRRLLKMAAKEKPDKTELAELENEIRTRMETIAEGGYRVEALEDSMTQEAHQHEQAPEKR
ncbi:MAG TPA: alpha-amylase family glycosyl hydrolase [Candidatus Angelobacter sp.]|nr:alpha-amylase family glycosyl hydrolase [Candidatus Angelobacter sp.]